MVYSIFSRYQYWAPKYKCEDGEPKKWTKWFRVGDYKSTEAELKDDLKRRKDEVKSIDKSTKLKHEFKIDEFDETTLHEYKTMII